MAQMASASIARKRMRIRVEFEVGHTKYSRCSFHDAHTTHRCSACFPHLLCHYPWTNVLWIKGLVYESANVDPSILIALECCCTLH